MLLIAQIIAGLVCLIHVYIFLLETVLFRSRGVKVFRIPPAEVEMRAVAMSNQGCYNGFLALALLLGFVIPNPVVASAFTVYGLVCVAIAGVWGAVTVMRRILYIQTIPALLGLITLYFAS
jgi:putative membrane protein